MSYFDYFHNGTIDIYNVIYTKDNSGGSKATPVEYLNNVASDVQPLSAEEVVRAGRQFSSLSYTVYITADIEVTMKDAVKYNNDWYNIVEINKYPTAYVKLVIEQRDSY